MTQTTLLPVTAALLVAALVLLAADPDEQAAPKPRSSTTTPGVAPVPNPSMPLVTQTTRLPEPVTPPPPPTAAFSPAGGRPFLPTSAFNTAIPIGPALDPRSRAMVSWLSGDRHPGIANLDRYGVPVWNADSSTPRHTVDCLRDWGVCTLEQERVPIPDGAVPSPGSDGAMVVIDWSTRRSYEFYEARKRTSGGWVTAWGGVEPLDGPGTPGAAVGAGISRLAGVVRTFEMAQGRIDHALVFSTDNACRDVFRHPASKTDGLSLRPDCIPEGARVQLDPMIDVDALPGLTKGERIVARALQTYGAFAIDNGGAKMAFIFEKPSGEASPYPSLGFTQDYFEMDRIPWSSLRVLRQWDGG